ncbi:MAG: AlpA family phage regulatory protein [Alphaproteobacteria bacterium]|nr:AlpA family phage regulatory protein [Alphaproteobacteria bacterium]
MYHFLQTCQPRKEIRLEKAANDNEPTLVSLNDACKLTSMSRTMLNRYRAEGRFPTAVPLDDRRVAFVRAEVMGWIREKVEARAVA